MSWKSFFMENCNTFDLKFFNPISKEEVEKLKNELEVIISGEMAFVMSVIFIFFHLNK